MNQLFIRLYVLVVTATLAAMAGSFVFVVTRVLPERNQELAELLVADLQELAERVEAQGPDALTSARADVGPALALLPLDVLEWSEADRAALRRGEVIVRGDELSRYAYVQVPSTSEVVEFELSGIEGRIVQWGALAIDHSPDPDDVFKGELTPLQEARLRYRPIALQNRSYLPSGLVVYERDGQRFQMIIDADGPQDVRLLGLGTMLLLLALAVILPLLPLHRQLSALGEAAKALGEGDTRARVPLIAGGGPVHPVAEQVNRMAQEIEDALGRNQELLRSVAHEMRTPLSRLVLALDLLQDDTPEARAARIAKLQQTVIEMQGLTDELLDFSRLGDRPEVARKTVNLVDVAHDVAGRWAGTVVNSASEPVHVLGEPKLITRAIENAVSNAVRYATPPTIGFSRTAQGWAVMVDDAGPGIAEADRQRIFEPFERLEASRSRDTGGTGLGLAIVRRILVAHGGTASIEDSPQGGARVRLEFSTAFTS
ncbi:MAG: ATP-binding protein [Myxococcota bacterium]